MDLIQIENSLAELLINNLPLVFISYLENLASRAGFYIEVKIFIFRIFFIALILALSMVSVIKTVFSIDFLLTFFLFILLFLISLSSSLAYIFFRIEQRNEKIEEELPDFLRQLSSLLRTGLGIEASLNEIVVYGSGTFNDEVKRMIIEIKLGRNFDESFLALSDKIRSKTLKNTFNIILEARSGGASIADTIENVAEDLREINIIKKERKTSVMMSVTFLLVSSLFAAPFSLAMVNIYVKFIETFGKTSSILNTVPLVTQSYILIHSFLVGLIIGRVMYSNEKKGLKFSFLILVVSWIIFNAVSYFGVLFLNI